MRKPSFMLALLLFLGLVAAHHAIPELLRPLWARPIPEAGTQGTWFPLPTASPAARTGAPVNAPENSLAGAAPVATHPPMQIRAADNRSPGTIILPDHPAISYMGRFDFTNPGTARFDWPGTTIEAFFTGTSITVILEPADNHFNLLLDGAEYHLLPGKSRYRFRVDPGLARHTIRLTKRTEAYAGTATFRGFVLDQGHRLLAPPAPATRRIEFVGDSITAGYGAAGPSAACDFSRDTQNVQLTYAALAAEAFAADYTVIAMSGLGAVRNYRQDAPTSAEPLLAFYPRTLALTPESSWSFSEWQADAVVINLGTNDFSSTPWPSETTFVDGYLKLIAQIRTHYPEAHIFIMAGPLLFGPAEEYIQSTVNRIRQVDDRVHFVPNAADLEAAQMGCDFHPNAAGHQRIARQLIPMMAAQLGWSGE